MCALLRPPPTLLLPRPIFVSVTFLFRRGCTSNSLRLKQLVSFSTNHPSSPVPLFTPSAMRSTGRTFLPDYFSNLLVKRKQMMNYWKCALNTYEFAAKAIIIYKSWAFKYHDSAPMARRAIGVVSLTYFESAFSERVNILHFLPFWGAFWLEIE